MIRSWERAVASVMSGHFNAFVCSLRLAFKPISNALLEYNILKRRCLLFSAACLRTYLQNFNCRF
jgi:hypothetical protein